MINKEILSLSLEIGKSYANTLEEVSEILASGAADTLDEAILILKRIHTDESEGHKTADGVSAII